MKRSDILEKTKYLTMYSDKLLKSDPMRFLMFLQEILGAYLKKSIKENDFNHVIFEIFVSDENTAINQTLRELNWSDLREIISIEEWPRVKKDTVLRLYYVVINKFLETNNETRFRQNLKNMSELITKEMTKG
ncbi:TPA: hypothetical protein H1009_04445 [archaeon]|nr:hypothetical protein [Candidatus Naiadarchaeales archaeon SRR2090153.bin461]